MKRILIIEDDLDVAEMFRALLTRDGYSCDVANEPATGEALARDAQYDLIVLDLMMPQTNGFTLTERIRRRDRLTPILMVTGRTNDPLLKGSARRSGVDSVMEKPVEADAFRERVRCMVNQ